MAKEQEFDYTARKPGKASPWLIVVLGAQIALLLIFFLFGGSFSG